MGNLAKSLLVVVLAGVSFTSGSCKKDHPLMGNAQLIGYDARECACCGGLEITIDNVSNPNGGAFFLVGQIPATFKLGDNPKFPGTVTIDYTIDHAHCFGNYVGIRSITTR